jgi:undecaprenyl-diphosphatase
MLGALYDRLRSQEILVFVALAIVAGGVWAFVAIADKVLEHDTQHFDDRVMASLHPRPRDPSRPPSADNPRLPAGPRWLQQIGQDITALGGVAVLSIVTAVTAGFLLMRRQYHAVVFLLVATLSGWLVSSTLKSLFNRPRPDISFQSSYVSSSSFPSGHSMLSAVVYLSLGALLARFVSGWRIRVYFLTVALSLTFLVGLSRVYMGVHFPTDVLAGWTAGLVWATLCWLAARYLQKRRTLEPPAEATPSESG